MPVKKKTNWSSLWPVICAIAAVILVPPAFRSCQLQEEQLLKTQASVPSTTQESVRPLLLSISPEKIFKDIDSHPPLQRIAITKSYVGNRVGWLLNFVSAREEKDGRVRVLLNSPPADPFPFPLIRGEVKLSDYPWLKTLHEGSKVHVLGTISDIDEIGIELDNVKLELR